MTIGLRAPRHRDTRVAHAVRAIEQARARGIDVPYLRLVDTPEMSRFRQMVAGAAAERTSLLPARLYRSMRDHMVIVDDVDVDDDTATFDDVAAANVRVARAYLDVAASSDPTTANTATRRAAKLLACGASTESTSEIFACHLRGCGNPQCFRNFEYANLRTRTLDVEAALAVAAAAGQTLWMVTATLSDASHLGDAASGLWTVQRLWARSSAALHRRRGGGADVLISSYETSLSSADMRWHPHVNSLISALAEDEIHEWAAANGWAVHIQTFDPALTRDYAMYVGKGDVHDVTGGIDSVLTMPDDRLREWATAQISGPRRYTTARARLGAGRVSLDDLDISSTSPPLTTSTSAPAQRQHHQQWTIAGRPRRRRAP